jgi:thiamine-phosphate pyrophosphorylase
MAESCLFYYITDRKFFSGDDKSRRSRLLDKVTEAASAGVDYIQLREKDLTARELETLAREAITIVRGYARQSEKSGKRGPALLVNSRTDVALAVAASGVHLPGSGVTPADVRGMWKTVTESNVTGADARKNLPGNPVVSIACHSAEEATKAGHCGADLALFAPVFEKRDAPDAHAHGLATLREACRAKVPVLALGGITLENAESCLRAGAAGIAAIRLFQENNIAEVVRELRIVI